MPFNRASNLAAVGQDKVMLVLLMSFFAVLTVLLIPSLVRGHEAAVARDQWRKLTNKPIIVETPRPTAHSHLYPVHARNISRDSAPDLSGSFF
jgi:hypothetical protein